MLELRAMKGAQKQSGFTIVELLIVIVVIAILAAITIVAYNGIQQRAKESAVKSELASTARKIQVAMAGSTTSTTTPPASLAAAQVTATPGATLAYEVIQSSSYYCVSATKSGISFYQTSLDTTQRSGTCPTVNGLVAWWPLNGTPEDIGGSAYHGVPLNNPTATTGQNGRANGAYAFSSAAQQAIDIAAVPNIPIERGTISVWVRPVNSGDVQNYVYYGSAGEDGCTGLPGYSLASCAFALQTNATGGTSTPFTGLALDNTWYHLVASWDGVTIPRYIRTYVNGVNVGNGSLGATPDLVSQAQYIGRPGSLSRFANGSIDDVKIYDRPLTAAEITALYQAGAQ